jgi:hypothetical protein
LRGRAVLDLVEQPPAGVDHALRAVKILQDELKAPLHYGVTDLVRAVELIYDP